MGARYGRNARHSGTGSLTTAVKTALAPLIRGQKTVKLSRRSVRAFLRSAIPMTTPDW
jgi:hypothetical protein